MSEVVVVGVMKKAIIATLMVSAPMLGIGLVIGLLISIFQAVTQLQEMTLTYVPKIFGVLLALLLFLPWMIHVFISFSNDLIKLIPSFTG